MKIRVKSEMSFDEINKYLVPVKEYGNEKINNNMYDDWNELEHTTKWIQRIKKSLEQNNEDILDIYYLKDKEKIIGVIFVLSGNNLIREFMKENNISSTSKIIAQLSCFHIIKDYRGIGKKWLESEVLKDLREQGIEEANKVADAIIKNTYRTLMTRGMKGCYVYCVDKELQEYLRNYKSIN